MIGSNFLIYSSDVAIDDIKADDYVIMESMYTIKYYEIIMQKLFILIAVMSLKQETYEKVRLL